jgi:uncharacterized protein YdeI (YjbR/CyaY-like superfamily)
MARDERVDTYIARQADFARPILEHLRAVVHGACPDCEEAIKWSMPAFLYKGKLLAGMAAFKAHTTFGLWERSAVSDQAEIKDGAMGQFGRITSIADLPPPERLSEMVRAAVAAVDSGAKAPRPRSSKPEPEMPADLASALAVNPAAQATFDGFPPSCRREYLEWVIEAKRPETRARRVTQAVEWMADGKRRHWKYENC